MLNNETVQMHYSSIKTIDDNLMFYCNYYETVLDNISCDCENCFDCIKFIKARPKQDLETKIRLGHKNLICECGSKTFNDIKMGLAICTKCQMKHIY